MIDVLERRLVYFLKLAQEATMAEAAERIGTTQSNLSTAIQSLEHSLDRELFTRTKRGMVLTSEGRRLYEELRPYQHKLHQILHGHGSVKIIRAGMTPEIFNQNQSLFRTSEGSQKKVSYQIYFSRSFQILQEVVRGKLDFGLVHWTKKPSNIEALPIFKEQMAIVGHHKYFSAIKNAKSLRELDDYPWVKMPKPQRDWDESLKPYGTAYIATSGQELRSLILNGFAIGEAQLNFFTPQEKKLLVKAPFLSPHPNVTTYLIYRKELDPQILEIVLSLRKSIKK